MNRIVPNISIDEITDHILVPADKPASMELDDHGYGAVGPGDGFMNIRPVAGVRSVFEILCEPTHPLICLILKGNVQPYDFFYDSFIEVLSHGQDFDQDLRRGSCHLLSPVCLRIIHPVPFSKSTHT